MVQEILELGQKQLPKLGVATVYREIARLAENAEIVTVSIAGDAPRYEMAKTSPPFKCDECNKVYEMEGCSKELLKLVPRGFKTQRHDLTFYGICNLCA